MKAIRNITTLLLAIALVLLLGACNTKTTQDENNTISSQNPAAQNRNDTSTTGTVTGGAAQNGGTAATDSGTTASSGSSSNATNGSNDSSTGNSSNNTADVNTNIDSNNSTTGETDDSTATSEGDNNDGITTDGNDPNPTADENNDGATTTDDNTTTGGTDDNATTDGSDGNTSTGTDDNTTTVPTVTLKSLKLTVNKTSLNKDENTTLKVVATYSDNTTKEVTDKVEWIVTPNDAVKITNARLTALQDKATTLKAKLNEKTSNAIDLNITWTVNGHTLPPEPDKALNDATLLGVDVNNNGVRDDVERWIYEKYKDKHPIHIDIAMQAARGYRLVLEHPERAKEIHDEVRKAVQCEMYYSLFADLYNEPLLVKEDITSKYFRHKIYFNTKNRMETYIKYDTLLSGDSYTLPNDKEKKAACDFNTSKYEE